MQRAYPPQESSIKMMIDNWCPHFPLLKLLYISKHWFTSSFIIYSLINRIHINSAFRIKSPKGAVKLRMASNLEMHGYSTARACLCLHSNVQLCKQQHSLPSWIHPTGLSLVWVELVAAPWTTSQWLTTPESFLCWGCGIQSYWPHCSDTVPCPGQKGPVNMQMKL